MAARDIMPFKSAHGGTETVRYGQMTASEVFDIGEPIKAATAGTFEEPPQDTTEFLIADSTSPDAAGIACFGPAGGAQSDDHAARIDPRTGVAFATLGHIAYWPFNEGTVFITRNFWTAAAGALDVPDLTDIGNDYQMTYGTFGTPDGGWGVAVDAGVASTDFVCTIVDVLDNELQPIRNSGNAGIFVTFTVTGI